MSKIASEARPDKLISIVGPNRSGKSTLSKALVDVVQVLEDSVSAGEKGIRNLPPEEIANIGVGYVAQIDDIYSPVGEEESRNRWVPAPSPRDFRSN